MFEDLGKALAAKRAGTKVLSVARDVGVTPVTFMRIERGGVPDLHTFEKLCRWLNRDPADFMQGVPQNHKGRWLRPQAA